MAAVGRVVKVKGEQNVLEGYYVAAWRGNG
jgi:hypothetical protein